MCRFRGAESVRGLQKVGTPLPFQVPRLRRGTIDDGLVPVGAGARLVLRGYWWCGHSGTRCRSWRRLACSLGHRSPRACPKAPSSEEDFGISSSSRRLWTWAAVCLGSATTRQLFPFFSFGFLSSFATQSLASASSIFLIMAICTSCEHIGQVPSLSMSFVKAPKLAGK